MRSLTPLELIKPNKLTSTPIKLIILACSILINTTLLSSCSERAAQEQENEKDSTANTEASNIDFQAANARLWVAGDKAFNTNIAAVEQLTQNINAFLNTPSAKTLTNAQQQWLKSTLQYQESMVFLQLAEAAPKTLPSLEQLRFRLGAFPIQPGFLDAFGNYKHAGLINDIGFPLSKESLTHQHGLTSSEDIALGFYAMEFMLFGINEDAREPSEYLKIETLTSAQRDIGYESPKELPQNRRRRLLSLQADTALQDTHLLKSIWAQQTKKRWSKLSAEQQLASMRTTRTSTTELVTREIETLMGITNNEALDSEVTKAPHPTILRSLKSQDQATFFYNNIKSLTATTAFFSNQQEVQAQLDVATDVLQILQQDSNGDETSALWKQAHTALNKLAQTL
ncbi:MAG: hypothetical protein COA42_10190 [Alteromonadaceae bacterium]|nr:MAG: hypothetical protein COA42_10190 [Alteromonadaceae bacterium]